MPKYPKYDGRLNLSGEIFREARLQQGLSCEELAQRLRNCGIPMSRTGIYRIEKGTRRVLYDECVFLTRILQLNPTEIEDRILQRLDAILNQNRDTKHSAHSSG